ncbi:peptidoglycan bridge formation glycyltransferase FemA/FemB family protein [Candidatus Saccharibacteria bacterium]|nr:peptidoglycan bridge formation glycyltransferase FemA/FemB family protein [Candidatus Saccharibacteria bacterium]
MNIPITQSKKWQKLQENLGEISHFESTDDYQFLAIEKHTKAGNYLFLPYGPVAETKEGFKKAISKLESIAKESNAIFIRIEPMLPEFAKILPKNSKKTKDIEPAETWILDLPQQENGQAVSPALKSLLPSRLYRYYKNREKQGITVETSHNPEDIKYLLKLQKALATKKGITTFTENYLKTELEQSFATLYLLKKDHNILAAGLVFDDEETKTRYNLQGAQSEEGRPLHATGILTIQLILDAVNKGYKTFDFWGIAPEGADKNHPWYGFTAFKKTFNGREQKYAGTYDIILNPTKYKLITALKKLKKLIH